VPFGAAAQASVQLGAALNRMGRRDEAVAAYEAALAMTTNDDPLEIRDRAREGLRERPDAQAAAAYRLSIEGWRALERGELSAAERSIEHSLALRPRDPVTRYRQAMLLAAQGDEAGALHVLEAIAAARGATPPTIYATACVDAARLLEQRGDRTRALDLYRTARTVFGADQRTKDAAQRALTRLSSMTPPRSPRVR
jgi:tetratricopeptide (TPR) repeat protein